MTAARLRRWSVAAVLLAIGLVVPLLGDTYYTKFVTRIMVYGMAALSVDILLGYVGLISLGHAAFVGLGAYVTGMLLKSGVTSAFISWPIAVTVVLLAALAIGALSLRTTGVYFIMITLAFAQMLYYVAQSLRAFGGDDGFALPQRNDFSGLIDINAPIAFYYFVLAVLVGVVVLTYRAMGSEFGVVVRASRDSRDRLEAVGIPSYRYRLVAFILSGGIAGIAGILLANLNQYVAPQGMLSWQLSGDLLVMVIFGGVGSLLGPIIGAAVFLILIEILSGLTEHWMLFLGPLLIARVLFVKDGIYTMLLKAIER